MNTAAHFHATAPGRTEEARVRNAEWGFANQWVEGLTAAELKSASKLKIPGDAGMAIAQEIGRRGGFSK